MSTHYLNDLLNKIHALIKCGAGTFKELSQDTGATLSQCYDWVNARRFEPSGVNAMKLHKWAERKTTQLATLGELTTEGRRRHGRYRSEYRKACERFPTTGKS